jgi:hypothetical protein
MDKKENQYFVVYQITNLLTNKIYVGAHITTNVKDKYFGSSKHLKKDIKVLGKENFKKEILFVFDSKEKMLLKEAEIVNKEFCFRTNTYNMMVGGITGSFSFKGMINVKDKEGNKLKVYIDDPRYLSGELIQVTKGTIPVVDKNGNNLRVKLDDPRYLSGELIFNRKGKLAVIDKEGNIFSVDKNDSRYLSGELSTVTKGKVTVVDKDGNTFCVDKNDPRYLFGELIHNLKDTIVVKDKNGNRFSVDKNDPRYLSKELVGWSKGRVAPNKGKTMGERPMELKKHLSELAKKRVGDKASGFGRSYINNGEINKRIKKEELDFWVNAGWIIGRKPFKHKNNGS